MHRARSDGCYLPGVAVVLAGDSQQLSVINRYAADRGFSKSFLERILERTPYTKDLLRFLDTNGCDPRLVTKLLYNYRSLPSILNVYNELFYDSELLPMDDEQNSREAELLERLDVLLPPSETRTKTHGAFFNGTRSENKQQSDFPSWFNATEAKNVFLFTIRLYRQQIAPDNIDIITPYMKQVKRIRNLFIEADGSTDDNAAHALQLPPMCPAPAPVSTNMTLSRTRSVSMRLRTQFNTFTHPLLCYVYLE